MPKVVPPKVPEYHSDQSRHEHLPSVPLRAVIAGPSGCGKTMLIVTMITDPVSYTHLTLPTNREV